MERIALFLHLASLTRTLKAPLGKAARSLSAAIVLFGVILGATFITSQAHAQAGNELRPAAIVNDDVISVLDLSMRIRLALLSTGLEDTPETRQQIGQAVLRSLIDEKLQTQEAERLEIQVSAEEVEAGVNQVATQNGMEGGQQLLQTLQDNGILPTTFIDQIRANLLWNNVVRVRIEPQISVTEQDVNAELEKLRVDAGKQERLVGEIFISFDNPNEEPQARAAADQIVDQLYGGASFTSLAQQFSQSATGAQGGSLGWVIEGELAPELEDYLARMQPGTISEPIRTVDGYYILALQRVRTVEESEEFLRMVQVRFPFEGEDEAALREQANQIMSDVRSCAEAEAIANQLGVSANANMGEVTLSSLPQNVRDEVAFLDIGVPSVPMRTNDGLTVYVVCLRNTIGVGRDRIFDALVREQLDILIRRYMRDLRRTANIDIRI